VTPPSERSQTADQRGGVHLCPLLNTSSKRMIGDQNLQESPLPQTDRAMRSLCQLKSCQLVNCYTAV